jgi:hypothetical protein
LFLVRCVVTLGLGKGYSRLSSVTSCANAHNTLERSLRDSMTAISVLLWVALHSFTGCSAATVALCIDTWSKSQFDQWRTVFTANPEFQFKVLSPAVALVPEDEGKLANVEVIPPRISSLNKVKRSADVLMEVSSTECVGEIQQFERSAGYKVDYVFNAQQELRFYVPAKLGPLATLLRGSKVSQYYPNKRSESTCDVITRFCPADHGIAQRGYFWSRDTAIEVATRRRAYYHSLSQTEKTRVPLEVLEQRLMHSNNTSVCALPVDHFPTLMMRRSGEGVPCIPFEEVEASCYPAGMEGYVQDNICGSRYARFPVASYKTLTADAFAPRLAGSLSRLSRLQDRCLPLSPASCLPSLLRLLGQRYRASERSQWAQPGGRTRRRPWRSR